MMPPAFDRFVRSVPPLRWLFETKDGRIVVGQFPNGPVLVAFGLSVAGFLLFFLNNAVGIWIWEGGVGGVDLLGGARTVLGGQSVPTDLGTRCDRPRRARPVRALGRRERDGPAPRASVPPLRRTLAPPFRATARLHPPSPLLISSR